MDELDKFVDENGLSLKNILKYVDEYSIYSFYIGQELEVGEKYSSPLRPKDDDPSFALYFSNSGSDDLMFKDHALGVFGNVLQFVQHLYGLTARNALLQINSNFHLGFSNNHSEFKPKVVKRDIRALKKEPVEIRITKKDKFSEQYKNYWYKHLDISQSTLDMYYVSEVYFLHFIRNDDELVVRPKNLCMAYEINGYYKTYQPFEKRMLKFRNNYPYGYVEGGLQLRWNKDICLITKSTKDIIFFREHFDIDAIAGTSENSMINENFMEMVFESYKHVLIWLDNDAAGKRAQEKYLTKYPKLISINPENKFNEKDPTDMYMYNQDKKVEVVSFINHTINTHLLNARKEQG